MPDEQQQAQFQTRLTFTKTDEGKYEIICMSAGIGNGWQIDAQVLRDSLSLWDNANSFVDHKWEGHSIRDLCGVITSPHWDEAEQGVKATFTPLGPAASVALSVAEDAILHPELAAGIGFSADVYFTSTDKRVDRFAKINSVDLVIDPARGGKFLRALHSMRAGGVMPHCATSQTRVCDATTPVHTPTQENPMPDPNATNTQESLDKAQKELEHLQAQSYAVQTAEQERTLMTKLQETNQAAERLRIQMCENVLASTLATSKLPAPVQERIRADFTGKVFEPAELQTRIEADREMVSRLTGPAAVQGPRLQSMFSSEDQITAAAQDLFGVERDENLKKVQPHRLSGIRELYHLLTGDYDLHGGYFPERVTFQMTTANFPIVVKNALNKALIMHWNEFGRAGYNWWENIVTIEHFTNLNAITWAIFGTVGSLPTVLEGAEYTPLKMGDGGETSSFVKKGGYIGITLEAIDRDDTRAFRAIPRELAYAAIREISSTVAALFTDNSGTGPDLADGGKLFNNTAVTTAGGHANLLTTAIGTDYVAWEAAASAMYNQPMLIANETSYYGTGKKMAVDPKYCLVPRALRGSANNLFLSRSIPGATVSLTSGKEWYGEVIPLTVPEWTDATDWAAVADPRLIPGIMIGERFGIVPEIYIAGNETDPAVFMNDENRIKVRHFTAIGACDFRPLHKNNV